MEPTVGSCGSFSSGSGEAEPGGPCSPSGQVLGWRTGAQAAEPAARVFPAADQRAAVTACSQPLRRLPPSAPADPKGRDC